MLVTPEITHRLVNRALTIRDGATVDVSLGFGGITSGFEPQAGGDGNGAAMTRFVRGDDRGVGSPGRLRPAKEALAEGVGFEPTVRFHAHTLSKRAP